MLITDVDSNRLLAALSVDDFEQIIDRSIIVQLVRGIDLVSPNQPITYCWFPLSGILSLIALDEDGGEAEVGLIGVEGMGDPGSLLGDSRGTSRLLVQIAGTAVRIEAISLQLAMQRSPELSRLMLAYVRASSIQIASSALAFARYSIPRRLARWLLMAGDRVGDGGIELTHDALSIMLGVRRAGVTVAIKGLSASKMIETKRGSIRITDRPGLRDLAGGSYGLAEAEYHRLLEAPLAKLVKLA